MVYSVNEIKMRLTPIFETAPVYKAVLFGSYAKGLATESSDVDIVIDSRGELLNIHFYGVLEDVTQVLNKKVDLLELSEVQNGSMIWNDINNDGVTLYEQ